MSRALDPLLEDAIAAGIMTRELAPAVSPLVFVAYLGDYSDRRAIGVFTSRDRAVAALEAREEWQSEMLRAKEWRDRESAAGRPLPDPYDIEEWAVDVTDSLRVLP
jgi:hypothetical protein